MQNDSRSETQTSSVNFLIGGGEMGELVRSMDWSGTSLGPIDTWPPSLRTAVNIVLNSNFPISLIWGPDHVQIYNDRLRPTYGNKHPESFGQDFTICWASALPVVGEAFRGALAGKSSYLEDQRIFPDRLGFLEEAFFTHSFSPIRDENGGIVGLFHPITETTSKIVGQRRARLLRDLATIGLGTQSLNEAMTLLARTIADDPFDLPFAMFYALDESQTAAHLVAFTGLPSGGTASAEVVDLVGDTSKWPIAEVISSGKAAVLDDVDLRFPELVGEPYPEPVVKARVLPIVPHARSSPVGVLVVGVSPRLPVDDVYATFLDMLQMTVNAVAASALARMCALLLAAGFQRVPGVRVTHAFQHLLDRFYHESRLVLVDVVSTLAGQPESPIRNQRG